MRTLIFSAIIFLASLSAPFSASATSCQPGYIERDDGSGCDLIQTTTPVNTAPTTPVNTGPTTVNGQNVRLINPLNTGECAPNENCLLNFLNKILDFVIRIGTVVVIFMLVYVGYLFVAARGNETKITEARNALLWTVIGALILLGSKAIALGIESTVKALSSGA